MTHVCLSIVDGFAGLVDTCAWCWGDSRDMGMGRCEERHKCARPRRMVLRRWRGVCRSARREDKLVPVPVPVPHADRLKVEVCPDLEVV